MLYDVWVSVASVIFLSLTSPDHCVPHIPLISLLRGYPSLLSTFLWGKGLWLCRPLVQLHPTVQTVLCVLLHTIMSLFGTRFISFLCCLHATGYKIKWNTSPSYRILFSLPQSSLLSPGGKVVMRMDSHVPMSVSISASGFPRLLCIKSVSVTPESWSQIPELTGYSF